MRTWVVLWPYRHHIVLPWHLHVQWVGIVQSPGKYWRIIIICLTKQTRHINRRIWVWWRTWMVDPACGYRASSSYFHVSQISLQTYIETMQPGPFEEWIEMGLLVWTGPRKPVPCLPCLAYHDENFVVVHPAKIFIPKHHAFSFFLSWVSKTQPSHWTKRMVTTWLVT